VRKKWLIVLTLALVVALSGVVGCVAPPSSEIPRPLSSFYEISASSAPTEDEGEDLRSFYGVVQEMDDGTYTLDGEVILEGSIIALESYVGQEVCIRGVVITVEPLRVEVRAIKSREQQKPGYTGVTLPVGAEITACGILQKTNGVYNMDGEVIFQSSVVDLEAYVGQVVHLKGKVITEEPLAIEVLSVE
jgi:hypothetical protein